MTTAIVVGAGPNGLAAAVVLARAGLDVTVLEAADTIGGGTRTAELTIPGLLHDVCSAVHPFGAGSPWMSSAPLDEHGLEWCWPEVDLVHPLDGARGGVMVRSLDATVAGLGVDGPAWRATYGPLAANFGGLAEEFMQPLVHIPRHPVSMVRFGLGALQSAKQYARRWTTDEARALFGGIAAHAIHPLTRPTTAAIGLMMGAAGHAVGWPVAKGGSQSIATALASLLEQNGGRIETGVHVARLDQIRDADVALFDVTPAAMIDIAGDALPNRITRAYRRYRMGPGAFKLDLAVEGGIPWTDESARRAGTVHLGGSLEEMIATEQSVHDGQMPERPFTLVAQPAVADPSRALGDVVPIWAYCHVPHGYGGDATEAIIGQFERFAPGTRERIVGQHTMGPAALEAYNANYVGGDIASGANDPLQVVMRPRPGANPYATGIPGVYLCSAATSPGAGVHGMCGVNAARRALRAAVRSR